jgi:hypothetical protein
MSAFVRQSVAAAEPARIDNRIVHSAAFASSDAPYAARVEAEKGGPASRRASKTDRYIASTFFA